MAGKGQRRGGRLGKFARAGDLSGWNVLLVRLRTCSPNPPDHRVCTCMAPSTCPSPQSSGRPDPFTRPPARLPAIRIAQKAPSQNESAVTRACTPVPRATHPRAAPARIASVTACRSTRVPTRSLARLACPSRAKKKKINARNRVSVIAMGVRGILRKRGREGGRRGGGGGVGDLSGGPASGS